MITRRDLKCAGAVLGVLWMLTMVAAFYIATTYKVKADECMSPVELVLTAKASQHVEAVTWLSGPELLKAVELFQQTTGDQDDRETGILIENKDHSGTLYVGSVACVQAKLLLKREAFDAFSQLVLGWRI